LLFLEKQGELMGQTADLAKAGVDVIVARSFGEHNGHVPLNADAIKNGIIAFVSGDETELANSDIYTFEAYNSTTGKWEQISIEDVAERFLREDVANNPYRYYDRLSNLDANLRCNNSFLGGKINTIRNAIKNSNFLATKSLEQYSSTTQIPNSENDIVQAYFSSCAKMLNCLEKDTSKIIDIGNSIDEINDSLKKDATTLNTSVNYYSGTSTNTNTSGNSWTSANSSGTSGYYGSSNSSTSTGTSSMSSNGSSSWIPVGGSSSTTDNSSGVAVLPTVAIASEFLKYNLLYSDYNKGILVYKNTKEKCKVVIHFEGDKILNIDHYYQYPTRQEASDCIATLKEKYGETCDNVLRETNTLKVVMDEATYTDVTLTELKAEYEKLEEMVELKKDGVENVS
jgi:hypothetical protein